MPYPHHANQEPLSPESYATPGDVAVFVNDAMQAFRAAGDEFILTDELILTEPGQLTPELDEDYYIPDTPLDPATTPYLRRAHGDYTVYEVTTSTVHRMEYALVDFSFSTDITTGAGLTRTLMYMIRLDSNGGVFEHYEAFPDDQPPDILTSDDPAMEQPVNTYERIAAAVKYHSRLMELEVSIRWRPCRSHPAR